MKISLKGLTGAATLLAAALGLNLLGPHRAYAAPGLALPGESDLGVTILSPDPHVPLAGVKPVEISAFYQGTPTNQIIAVELYLDGVRAAAKTLDVPETRGVVSFLVDAGQITAGTHKIVVRATAADQEVKSARSAFVFGTADNTEPMNSGPVLSLPGNPAKANSGEAPTLRLINPSEDGKVRGVVTLHIEATDPSGKAPYVSLFIDKTFKTLRNFAPYEFEWDTTAYSNGYHTIEAFGYNDSPNVGQSKILRLYVNNEGGNTQIRHDLLDGVKTVKPAVSASVGLPRRVAVAPRKVLGRPLPQRRPDAAATASVLPAMPVPAPTHEILRQMARAEAASLHFGSLRLAAELSSPFVAETSASQTVKPPRAASATPMQGFKPMRVSPAVDPNTAALAALPTPRVSSKRTLLPRMAMMRVTGSELASPFLAEPHVGPLPVMPQIHIGSYLAEMRMAHQTLKSTIKPALKMHPLRVHFPASMGSLLRSVGQTSLLFNHTTVKLDRPLTSRSHILFGPLRQIFEQGGGTLTWQARTGTVHAKNATKDIVLTIGKPQALINAKAVALDGTPYLLTGRTMVPLSFVTAAMDADVQYDAATGHLLITSRK